MQSGTIHDSWDHNSAARNSNLEMINAAIRMGTAMADLINSRNAVTASGLSGSSQTTDFPDRDDDLRETTGLCDARAALEWDAEEQACVDKREQETEVQLLLQPQ